MRFDSRLWLGLFLLLALLFLIANRGAYKSYFQDDDLDNLASAQDVPMQDFLVPLLLPRYFVNNFRPVGHLFYRVMGSAEGLSFPPYIAAVHVLHLANVLLLWVVLRRLGLNPMGAAAGALLFAFNLAVFDVYWKAMYVFDLLCCTFCLLSLWTFIQGHWIGSMALFLIAYHAKEVAILLPVVLLAYEFLLGERRWKRLVPFFLVALWIGIQALVFNHQKSTNDYSLRFDPLSIYHCVLFYSYHGLLVLPCLLLVFSKDRRVVFGVLTFWVLLLPMLLLPGRLFSAYLYVPLIGLSIALGALAVQRSLALAALFFLLWLPWNYMNLRWFRKGALSEVADRRAYVQGLVDLGRKRPDILTFLYDKGPVNSYGTRGAVDFLHRGQPVHFATLADPDSANLLRADKLAVLNWDAPHHRLSPLIRDQDTLDASYIQINQDTPIWQLESGWYPREGAFRWTAPTTNARLRRPAQAKQFEILVNVGPEYIAKVGRSHVSVLLDGNRVGDCEFTHAGWQSARWELAAAPAGSVEVTIETSPPLRLSRLLGSAVVGFGFLPKEKS